MFVSCGLGKTDVENDATFSERRYLESGVLRTVMP